MWLKTEIMKHYGIKSPKYHARNTELDSMIKSIIERDCGKELSKIRSWKWRPLYPHTEIIFDFDKNNFCAKFNMEFRNHANCNIRKVYEMITDTYNYYIDNLYAGTVSKNDKQLIITCGYNKEKILNGQ